MRSRASTAGVAPSGAALRYRETLKSLEQRLDPEAWVQVHRSAVVPLREVQCLLRGPAGARVRLADGAEVPVSVTYLARLEAALAARG